MARCTHCGLDAGFFKDAHSECIERLNAVREGLATVTAALMAGRIPVVRFPDMSLVLPDGERPIWFYNDVREVQQASKRRYVAGSRGLSIRLMKGVSFRVGASAGTSISESYEKAVDAGTLILSTHNLYFIGEVDTDVLALGDLFQFDSDGDAFRADDKRRRLNLRMRSAEDAMSMERLVRLILNLPEGAEVGALEHEPKLPAPTPPALALPAVAASGPAPRVFGKRSA